MKLLRHTDKLIWLLSIFVIVFIFAFIASGTKTSTFADSETYVESADKFVILYDNGKRLTIRTDATTVGEALERANIQLGAADKVEPELDSPINTSDFFINIYRARPAIILDGLVRKHSMTASYDKKTIAKEAGFTIYDGDNIEQIPNANFLEYGTASVYQISRGGGNRITIEEEIPFSEQTIKDYNLTPGTREVRQMGEVGAKTLVYDVLSIDGEEISRTLVSETIVRQPVVRIVAIGASQIEKKPLTRAMGRNRYTVTKPDGTIVERQETYYDLPMGGVMAIAARECGVEGRYTVRADGVKVDAEGYILIAAHLGKYPRCTVVETSLGLGKVYDTGTFANTNSEQFDIATDWTNRDGI